MKIRKRYLLSLLSIFIPLLIVTTVLAAYSSNLTLSNTSDTNYDNTGFTGEINIENIQELDMFDDDEGLDSRVFDGTTELPHMLATDRVNFVTDINVNSSKTLTFSTNNTALDSFSIVPGYSNNSSVGYIETADSPTIEGGDNTTISLNGIYLQDGNNLYKQEAFTGDYDVATENFTFGVFSSYSESLNWTTPDSCGGISWVNPTNATDDNTATYAQYTITGSCGCWSDYLTANITSNLFGAVRIWSSREDANVNNMQVDVYYASAWHSIYNGVYTGDGAYHTFSIGSYQHDISSVRIRYQNNGVANKWVRTHEIDFNYPDTNYDPEITATGITEGEYDIEAGIGAKVTDIIELDNAATISASMGQGMIPCVLLEEIELTSAASSITFDDIADQIDKYEAITGETARHLVVMVNAASTSVATRQQTGIRFNGDSDNNYNWQLLQGISNSATASRSTSTSLIGEMYIPGTSYSNAFGGGTILIPHAFNTSNHKSALIYGGAVEDVITASAGRWANTNAITSITMLPYAGNFVTGSVFQLCVVDERYNIGEATPNSDNVTFAGIAGTGNNLCMIGYERSNRAATTDWVYQEINTDATGGNYLWQYLRGANAAISATSTTGLHILEGYADSATTNAYSTMVVFLSEYAETSNDEVYLSIGGDNTYATLLSGRRNNTSAITQLEYRVNAGTGFTNGSLFSLYRVPQYTIERYELTDNTTHTITFSNIPQTYGALQINVYARTLASAIVDSIYWYANSDTTGAHYDRQRLLGAAAVVSADRNTSSPDICLTAGNTAGANEFGSGIITFPQYTASDRNKHVYCISGSKEDYVGLYSGRWESNNPITTIAISALSSANFTAGTIIELIGTLPNHVCYLDVDDIRYGEYNQEGDGISIPNTSYNWIFRNFVYADNIIVSVNGTQQLWYEPNEIISSDGTTGNLTDRSDNSNTGIIYWGGLPTGISTSFSSFLSDYEDTIIGEDSPTGNAPINTSNINVVSLTDAQMEIELQDDIMYEIIETLVDDIWQGEFLTILQVYQFATIIICMSVFIILLLVPSFGFNLSLASLIICIISGIAVTKSIFYPWIMLLLIPVLIFFIITEGRRLSA